ncbi:hypothetical protein [Streptomyces sp. NRRL F-525]|uniref:hypothetical protein n=1 Tax=Streptomyces sp. NRRL F-525 TaxID=1463861 RepID=UPI00131A66D8|nr:hypothetical protein [Streptomyces sp. NRRL F-525]
MSTPSDDVESNILSSAETMLGSRLEVIKPLAGILAERKRLQALIDATDKPYGVAYAKALAAGWTTNELTGMGAEEPMRRQPGRPKGSRTRKTRSGAGGATEVSATSS